MKKQIETLKSVIANALSATACFLALWAWKLRRVPKELIDPEQFIGEMRIGDTGYTVPWAASLTNDGVVCGVNPNYTLRAKPGGTVKMLVTRKADGYHIYPPEPITQRGRWPNAIPVTGVHGPALNLN